MTYTLYGAPLSLYTGKARAYLRRQGIDFVERSPGTERYRDVVMPVTKRFIIPVMETPDGEIIQDGADIIDHFEKGPGQHLRAVDVYPDDPTLLAISHVFEVFGGEGLLRPAMHYRWNFNEQNLDFLAAEYLLLMPPADDEEKAKERFLAGSGRMRNAARAFGVVEASYETIEESFGEFLDLFSAHLGDHPYLLGGQPTIGDFGLIASMWAHLYRDPVPAMLIKQRAPRVGRWVERMTTAEPYLHEYRDHDGSLIDGAKIPETLLALMRYVAEEYLPELVAHVEATNEYLAANPDIEAGTNGLGDPGGRSLKDGKGFEGRGTATFEWRGMELTTGVMPYRFWLMQKLHDDLAGATPDQQAHTREVFRAGGLEPWLDLRTLRRVERIDNLEVWGATQS
ncbi:MAG: glutathione S-transferase C-terminal domain-containing protein [Actinomycetota bacterium]